MVKIISAQIYAGVDTGTPSVTELLAFPGHSRHVNARSTLLLVPVSLQMPPIVTSIRHEDYWEAFKRVSRMSIFVVQSTSLL